MAGRGPPPKPDHLRQRRNKTPGAAQLPTAEESAGNEVPDLPEKAGGWHRMTAEWWVSVWRSPMASEYLDTDMRGGLFQLAYLHDLFWQTADFGYAAVNKLPALATEIRQQEVRFGLSPIDRSRLRWQIAQGDAAEEQTEARRARKQPLQAPIEDPRSVLKVS